MPFEGQLNTLAEFIAALTLGDAPTYVELTDGSAGLISQVSVEPPEQPTLTILVTSLSEAGQLFLDNPEQGGDSDPDIKYERKRNSPEQTYATAKLSKVAVAKRPPNG